MFKALVTRLFVFFLFLFLYPKNILAIAKFNTTYQVYYKVLDSGITHVTYAVSQKNNLSVVYATEYGISINETKIANLKILDEGVSVIPNINKIQSQTIISFPFAKKVVGKNKVHSFTIEYDTSDIVTKKGSTVQIDIPRFETDENVTEQTAILILPDNFPKPAYIDPKPDVVNNNTYYFSSKIMSNKPISAIFGTNQYYKAKIKYFLKNDTNSLEQKTITLIPDTNYQNVYYETINPTPEKLEVDVDGNLIAYFTLKPQSQIDIDTLLYIKTDYKPNNNTSKVSDFHIDNNQIWDYEDLYFTSPEIKSLTSPKAIFWYLADKLRYDYQKINKNGTVRVPASSSLKNSISAICTDFADSFVALSRRAKIPAREIEGWAISDNPDLKPISATQDILHAWAEYWDESSKRWIQVDPTWSSTTKGLDYFNKLDFNHITFAIHSQNPLLPQPAGAFKNPSSKEKDINIEAIGEKTFPAANFEVKLSSQGPLKSLIVIKNLIGVYGNGAVEITGFSTNYSENISISPFGTKTIVFKKNFVDLFRSSSDQIIIRINGKEYGVETSKNETFSKIGIFAGFSIFLGIITFAAWRLLLRRQR